MSGYKISFPRPPAKPSEPPTSRPSGRFAVLALRGVLIFVSLLAALCVVLAALVWRCAVTECGSPWRGVLLVLGLVLIFVARTGMFVLEMLGQPSLLASLDSLPAGGQSLSVLGLSVFLGAAVWGLVLWGLLRLMRLTARGFVRVARFIWRPPPAWSPGGVEPPPRDGSGALLLPLFPVAYVLFLVASIVESGFSWRLFAEVTLIFAALLPFVLAMGYLSSAAGGRSRPSRAERTLATIWLLLRRALAFAAALVVGMLGGFALYTGLVFGVVLLAFAAYLIWFGWVGSGGRNDSLRDNYNAHQRRKRYYGW